MEQWSAKYGTTTDLAATAFREFAESLSNQPPSHRKNNWADESIKNQNNEKAKNLVAQSAALEWTFISKI